jgi:hypothetical protein
MLNCPQPPADVYAAKARHPDVNQESINMLLESQEKTLLPAVSSDDSITVLLKHLGEDSTGGCIVIGNKYRRFIGRHMVHRRFLFIVVSASLLK